MLEIILFSFLKNWEQQILLLSEKGIFGVSKPSETLIKLFLASFGIEKNKSLYLFRDVHQKFTFWRLSTVKII